MKQAILVRSDLQLPKGKACSQAAHAAVEAALNSDRKIVAAWREEGSKKVVLKVKDDKELVSLHRLAKGAGLVAVLITDAGRTAIAPGTRTVVGIGPDEDEKVDEVVGALKLL